MYQLRETWLCAYIANLGIDSFLLDSIYDRSLHFEVLVEAVDKLSHGDEALVRKFKINGSGLTIICFYFVH